MMGLTLGELAQRVGATLQGNATIYIHRVKTLTEAGPGDVSFLSNSRYRRYLANTRAAAVILGAEDLTHCPVPTLMSENPYLAFAKAVVILNPPPPSPRGVHSTAVIDPSAEVDESAWVGPLSVVEARAKIEAGVIIGPGCIVGTESRIGSESRLVASVTVCDRVRIGARVILHPGAVIGGDGFGLARDGERWFKIPQVGSVIIGDDVEIGANTTVDRGTLEDTVIEEDVRIDNQVQIAHNCYIGAHTAIAGCVGIAGSARIGRRCTIAGAAGIAGHLEICDDVHITAMSMVVQPITEPGVYSSNLPAAPNRQWRRNVVRFHHLDTMAHRLRAIEQQLATLVNYPARKDEVCENKS
ncbi:UDP-3-O-(3-hydroxymyristoyl)glucosamine N-acyltransferase [Gammaproteobacteria bacterium]